jgi:hypothetical protein
MVTEEVRFDAPEDYQILEAIARQYQTPVRVRLTAGGHFYQDFELSQAARQAIRDTWLASNLLKKGVPLVAQH